MTFTGDAGGEWFDFAHHPELVEGSSIFFKENHLKKIESLEAAGPVNVIQVGLWKLFRKRELFSSDQR